MRRVLAPTVGTAYMATSVVRPSALAAGGAVVLGAHPHVLQPVERPDRFRPRRVEPRQVRFRLES
jgi:hypothetical protein